VLGVGGPLELSSGEDPTHLQGELLAFGRVGDEKLDGDLSELLRMVSEPGAQVVPLPGAVGPTPQLAGADGDSLDRLVEAEPVAPPLDPERGREVRGGELARGRLDLGDSGHSP